MKTFFQHLFGEPNRHSSHHRSRKLGGGMLKHGRTTRVEQLERRDVPAVFAPTVGMPSVKLLAAPQTLTANQQIIAFCQSHLQQKVGGGECAHLVQEALRVAGANFVTTDPNHNGDYVWGTLLTTITRGSDSAPATRCQPGDIIQFQNVTMSGGWTAAQHTAIVAAVDSLGRPTQVYEQNVGVNGKGAGVHDRTDRLDPLAVNLNSITAGTVHIYRAVPRPAPAGMVQFTAVNNTATAQTVTVYLNGNSVGTLSLDSFNKANSYKTSWFTATGTVAWTIGINGAKVPLTNAGGYEVFTAASGLASIRAL